MANATEQARLKRTPDRGPRIGSRAAAAFGLIASLGAATAGSCCALPLALASLGIGGAWLGSLAILIPYRPYLLGVAVVGLGIAWISAIGRVPRRTRHAGLACGRRKTRRWTLAALALSTVLVMYAAASNWLEPLMVQALLGWARPT